MNYKKINNNKLFKKKMNCKKINNNKLFKKKNNYKMNLN